MGHHLSHDNMEYALQMELWKGNISGVIQLARERAQLSDWIVSLAPLGESVGLGVMWDGLMWFDVVWRDVVDVPYCRVWYDVV